MDFYFSFAQKLLCVIHVIKFRLKSFSQTISKMNKILRYMLHTQSILK